MELPKVLLLEGISFDIIITLIGVLYFGGKEGNQFINWIQPNSLMMLIDVIINLLFIFGMLYIPKIINPRYYNYYNFVIGGIGIGRIGCGLTWILY